MRRPVPLVAALFAAAWLSPSAAPANGRETMSGIVTVQGAVLVRAGPV